MAGPSKSNSAAARLRAAAWNVGGAALNYREVNMRVHESCEKTAYRHLFGRVALSASMRRSCHEGKPYSLDEFSEA